MNEDEPRIGRVTRTGTYCTETGVESGTASYETGEWFTIYAEDGEYGEYAPDIGEALARFRSRRPDCFVSAVVADGMRPRLIIEDTQEGS